MNARAPSETRPDPRPRPRRQPRAGGRCLPRAAALPAEAEAWSVSGEVEEWFFEPSDSSPVVVLILCGWLLWRRRARLARSGAIAGRSRGGGPGSGRPRRRLRLVRSRERARPPGAGAGAGVARRGESARGTAALRVVAPPAAVLLLALPLPAPLLEPDPLALQIWTADFTGCCSACWASRAGLRRSHHHERRALRDHRDLQRHARGRDVGVARRADDRPVRAPRPARGLLLLASPPVAFRSMACAASR